MKRIRNFTAMNLAKERQQGIFRQSGAFNSDSKRKDTHRQRREAKQQLRRKDW